jgi:sigma-70-like protein
MSGLETLPPDQRAVLQLILRQGRGYEDLAGMLKIDVRAVRDRAHAGLAALGGPAGATLPDEHRARIADYVLGQQDDAERIVTLAELGESPAAATWARDLRARLAPLATTPLPEIPAHEPVGAAAATGANGAAPASGTWREVTPAPAVATAPSVGAEAGANRPPASPTVPHPSRLGGAILLGAIGAVLVAILLIVLLSGGSGTKKHASTGASRSTPAQTSTQSQTQPSAQPVAQVNFKAAIPGGHALGVGVVEQQSGGQLILAAQAEHLAANTPQDAYALWLNGPSGTKLLGFVPQRVGKDGTFAVSSQLPANAKQYTSVLVSREPNTKTPAQPTTVVLSGALNLP